MTFEIHRLVYETGIQPSAPQLHAGRGQDGWDGAGRDVSPPLHCPWPLTEARRCRSLAHFRSAPARQGVLTYRAVGLSAARPGCFIPGENLWADGGSSRLLGLNLFFTHGLVTVRRISTNPDRLASVVIQQRIEKSSEVQKAKTRSYTNGHKW